jgi:hypothetical protein
MSDEKVVKMLGVDNTCGGKRVLFFGFGGSHITPQLDIARSLLREGHHVFFVTIVETIPLADELPDSFHVVDLVGALQWGDHSSTFLEKMRSDPAADVTGLMLSSLGEPLQNIPPPGDILWQCALDQRWDWFEHIVRQADPCAIVFDTILDGYGKYMGMQFGIPAYGTCPVLLDRASTTRSSHLSGPSGHRQELSEQLQLLV